MTVLVCVTAIVACLALGGATAGAIHEFERNAILRRHSTSKKKLDAVSPVPPLKSQVGTDEIHVNRQSIEDSTPSQALYAIALNAWRLRRRILNLGDGKPTDEFRRELRFIDTIVSELENCRVRITDNVGEEFDIGMPLRVIAYEKRPDLTQETIVETVKPSIYHNDFIVQAGEVIVGTPADSQRVVGEA